MKKELSEEEIAAITVAFSDLDRDGDGVITLDEWGFPILSSHDLPDKQHGAARIAQWTCPAAALRVTR